MDSARAHKVGNFDRKKRLPDIDSPCFKLIDVFKVHVYQVYHYFQDEVLFQLISAGFLYQIRNNCLS